jgi:hypothetical protein
MSDPMQRKPGSAIKAAEQGFPNIAAEQIATIVAAQRGVPIMAAEQVVR